MPESFKFSLHTAALFGAGSAAELVPYLREQGHRKIGLVIDSAVLPTQPWQEVHATLEVQFELVLVQCTVAEPDYDYLDVARKPLESGVDCVVGVGGGSALDLAKALSVLITNPKPAIEYRGFNLVENSGPPVVAIPTTAGTGSEVTPNAVFTDSREQRKLGINTSLYLPKLALLDPLLTLSCPRSVTLSAGMDALVHSVESYVARGGTPVSRTFSRAAFALVFNTLRRVVEAPADVDARLRMQIGAYYAGIALMNSGAGPAGAMSYPLGARFKVPHGIAGGMFLPAVVEYNVRHGATIYADLYELIDGADRTRTAEQRSGMFSDSLRELCDTLGVPRSLSAFDVPHDKIPELAEQTALLKGALEQNPIPFSVPEVEAVFARMS